ncbi:hypothetical protein AB6A40_004586 [Gnathostoma spinigerum]|uniref:Integral membrane protein 2 n=1 Tax=Gnathostoma spinigerum TaxID=75299 RepID=A0ABD6EF34_9BILA
MTVFTKTKELSNPKKVTDSNAYAYTAAVAVNTNDEATTLTRLRRYKAITTCCLALLVLWLIIAAFLAGIFFYRQFYRRPTFYGWCGTDFVNHGKIERLEESVQISPDEQYEEINVPRFGVNRPAIFVHDFRKNLTAIVDILSNRCFIKQLDRSVVSPPTSLIDLVEKMESGYYESPPAVMHETYRVMRRLSNSDIFSRTSPMINRHCSRRTSFLLRKIARFDDRSHFLRNKRGTVSRLTFTSMGGEVVEIDEILFSL